MLEKHSYLGRVIFAGSLHLSPVDEKWDTVKQPVKLIQRGRPQHIVSAFFDIGGCYDSNIALVKLCRFNKVGKKIGIFRHCRK